MEGFSFTKRNKTSFHFFFGGEEETEPKKKPKNVLSSGAGYVILGRMKRTRFAQTTFHLFLPRITQPLKTPSCGMFLFY